jgi:hypothetical protein
VVLVGSFRTVDDAAATASTMISSGRALTDVWRHAVPQLLDDYVSVLRHEGTQAAEVSGHAVA